MPKYSVVDQPVRSYVQDGRVIKRNELKPELNPDKLGTGSYASALAKFIMRCDTPMTIGIQGEWGSGKTSLLNMIREDIEQSERTHYRNVIKGEDEYKSIWINTWEHSILKTPEACLLSIIEEIISRISSTDGSFNTAQKAKSALFSLSKGILKVGSNLALGTDITEMGEFGAGTTANPIKQLRASLDQVIKTVVTRNQNPIQRFIVFIDDLDRLEPSLAVKILELLKNIFTIEHCVFVLAIDYQVVVKGLKEKFGEPNESNEWEFRAFFDKIIQLPFMMPMASYDVKNYVNRLLMDEIGYFKLSERKLIEDGRLAKVVKLSLGYNPRAMKRLLNSLALLKLQHADLEDDYVMRQLVFALVCLQISYPKVYELLLRNPNYAEWDEAFADKVCGRKSAENDETSLALNKAFALYEEDFDETWEQALFRIVWEKKWNRNRVREVSQLISEISDTILEGMTSEVRNERLVKGLRITAVTAVTSTDEGVFGEEADDTQIKQVLKRVAFWRQVKAIAQRQPNRLTNGLQKLRGAFSQADAWVQAPEQLGRKIYFKVGTSHKRVLRVHCSDTTCLPDNLPFFQALEAKQEEFEALFGSAVRVKWKINSTSADIAISLPKGFAEDSLWNEPSEVADRAYQWVFERYPALEEFLFKVKAEVVAQNQRHDSEVSSFSE